MKNYLVWTTIITFHLKPKLKLWELHNYIIIQPAETDKAIEDLISSKVKEKYPEHGFIGEETVSADGKYIQYFKFLITGPLELC